MNEIGLNDLPITSTGLFNPGLVPGATLEYYSVINKQWCRVLLVDTTGNSVGVSIEHPEGGNAQLIIHRIYLQDMRFRWVVK